MAKTPRITLYSTAKCGHCRQAQDFLKKNAVPFVTQDIQKNQRAFKEFQQLGGRGVPLIKIGATVIKGFDPGLLKKQLTKAGFNIK